MCALKGQAEQEVSPTSWEKHPVPGTPCHLRLQPSLVCANLGSLLRERLSGGENGRFRRSESFRTPLSSPSWLPAEAPMSHLPRHATGFLLFALTGRGL